MTVSRVVLLILVVLTVLQLFMLVLGEIAKSGKDPHVDGSAPVQEEPPRLRGSGTPPPLRSSGGDAATGGARQGSLDAMADERIEVLDYRDVGVAGVEVFHEVDLLDLKVGPGVRWKTLANGTTNAAGVVHLLLDRFRPSQPGEGVNHRLRLVPPKNREDLSPTWRLWTPALHETYRMSQSHVIEGRVLDASGEPVWQASVWIGDLPDGSVKVVDPAWRNTKTDPDGYFRFSRIPTTADWRIEVWAVAPWEVEPRSSADVQNAQSVALDERAVELRLE